MSASLAAPLRGGLPRPGFLPGAVPFAARATASLLAYGVAFAIQLDAASSAGLCVAIVVNASPGGALAKAAWRVVGTVVGGAVLSGYIVGTGLLRREGRALRRSACRGLLSRVTAPR